jgi:hypothetical protein
MNAKCKAPLGEKNPAWNGHGGLEFLLENQPKSCII